jgi:hypothetical protein
MAQAVKAQPPDLADRTELTGRPGSGAGFGARLQLKGGFQGNMTIDLDPPQTVVFMVPPTGS